MCPTQFLYKTLSGADENCAKFGFLDAMIFRLISWVDWSWSINLFEGMVNENLISQMSRSVLAHSVDRGPYQASVIYRHLAIPRAGEVMAVTTCLYCTIPKAPAVAVQYLPNSSAVHYSKKKSSWAHALLPTYCTVPKRQWRNANFEQRLTVYLIRTQPTNLITKPTVRTTKWLCQKHNQNDRLGQHCQPNHR